MQRWPVISAVAFFLAFGVSGAICQVASSADSSTQARKRGELGRPPAEDLGARDGNISDPGILEYLQQLAGRLASASGAPALQVRLTRSRREYTSLLPNRVLYISAGLLDRTENEAELAGLLAHQLAHTLQGQQGPCVLASALTPSWTGELHELERQATAAAISYLKGTGYDPAGVLDLLSKLAYEHPAWRKVISSEDLLQLRVGLEAEAIPKAGYRLDSSGFRQFHKELAAMLNAMGKASARPTAAPSRKN